MAGAPALSGRLALIRQALCGLRCKPHECLRGNGHGGQKRLRSPRHVEKCPCFSSGSVRPLQSGCLISAASLSSRPASPRASQGRADTRSLPRAGAPPLCPALGRAPRPAPRSQYVLAAAAGHGPSPRPRSVPPCSLYCARRLFTCFLFFIHSHFLASPLEMLSESHECRRRS